MLAIHPVAAFRDNYIWVIEDGRHAAAVDPGDAAPVEAFLAARGLVLSAVLATHHHADHVGGLVALARKWKCATFGPARESIAGLDHRLAEGDRIEVPGVGLALEALDIPGHTAGHIALAGDGVVFCGDTLFACGCGRLFEGTAAQMLDSLSRLAALPDATRVYCGHEYTVANIAFARAVEPDNALLAQRERSAKALRAQGKPTLPSTLGEERATNPFLRSTEPAVVESVNKYLGSRVSDPVKVFAAIREWKNRG